MPGSTPDRVAEKTERLTQDATNPYDTARTIERWLERNRHYSLDVEKPSGNVADAFLFEMREGYCVYYATTMAVMLRTQDIPARVTVGYTPGQPVGGDTYLVRGYNSHAWVEVYLPEQGWVAFDPTPASPRQTAEQARLEEARATGAIPVDAAGSGPGGEGEGTTTTPPPTETVTAGGGETPDLGQLEEGLAQRRGEEGGGAAAGNESEEGGLVPVLPSRRQLALAAVAVLGLAAGLRRSGLGRRAYLAVWLRFQRRRDPDTDVERAYRRVLTLLESEHRSKERGETPRQFFDAIDAGPRPRRILAARERARHGGGVDASTADETVDLADRLVGERVW